MKTHRIILPRDQHAAALAGVDRLLLPMDLRRQEFDSAQPAEGIAGAWCRFEVNGWAWWGPLNKDGRALRYQQGVNCLYKPGDRLALREPWDEWIEVRSRYIYKYSENMSPDAIYQWQPASRMPLHACRCFYRVLESEPVRECDAWAWAVRPVEPANSGLNWAWAVRVERWTNA